MVGGVALGGQRPALDRVGEDDRRAVAHRVGRAVGVEQRLQVVAAEVAEGGQQRACVEVCDQSRDGAVARRQALAQVGVVGAQQALVLLVAHRVDALAQRLAAVAREQRAQPPAVLDRLRVPARRLEHRPQPAGCDVGHDAIERLAVEVDDPQHLAQPRDHRIGDRLPDRALVELGVAEQRDLAPAARDVEVARPRSGGPARPRSSRWPRCRRFRSSSRPGRGPWCGSGRTAGRRTRAGAAGSRRRAGRAGS